MNPTPTIHLCLVSAQATPNLTATLDPAVFPRRVVLLTSPDMQRRAQWLEQVLKPRGIEVDIWPIDNAWDIVHIRDRVLELLVRYPDESIALNATGGTKPMSIAAPAISFWGLILALGLIGSIATTAVRARFEKRGTKKSLA